MTGERDMSDHQGRIDIIVSNLRADTHEADYLSWARYIKRLEAECDRLREVVRESLRVVWLYHEWLEKHEQFNTAPDGRRTGYIGIDHKVGENVEGCSGCAALAEGGEK